MDSFTWQLILLIVLLILSGFFSASETALMSLSKIRTRHLVEENVKGAKLLEKLIDDPNKLLGSILIANNIVNIGASALASSVAAQMIGGTTGVAIATVTMTILILIFGEITPKSLAKQNTEEVSLKVIKPISVIVKLFTPFVWILGNISSIIIKLFGGDSSRNQPFITQEELKTMVDVSEEEGVLEVEEKEMIYNVFEFGDLQVKDVMVQRVDIISVNIDATYEDVKEVIKEEQFSRIPVYNETIDDIVGVLNVKDLIFIDDYKTNFIVKNYMREPFYTFEFKKITELFNEMKKSRNHIAVVLDEYGGTVGVVTIEDLVEEIVGEIEDEYDSEKEKEIKVIKEDEYVVEGSVRLHDLSDEIGVNIESEEFDSVGGFILGLLGRIPIEKEEVEFEGIKFIVEEIDKNRIKKVRIFT